LLGDVDERLRAPAAKGKHLRRITLTVDPWKPGGDHRNRECENGVEPGFYILRQMVAAAFDLYM
jgi:hypothetical protein